ncbi:hypothetical protein [Lentzea sp. CA-135723]|uniref:hypothetical protein n=1 Tax=Lentzea sp. CA-135723 TaxID=3239950 RepID=UPI003D8B3B21
MMIEEPSAPRKSLARRVLTYALVVLVAAVAIYGVSELLAPVQTPKSGDCADATDRPGLTAASCDAKAPATR